MKTSTRKICLLAVGVALFAALSMCLQVPVFENYYLCLGYVVMAVYCYCFGTVCGTVAGTFGVIAYCLLINGLRGMPGWALGNVVIGIILGLAFQMTGGMKNQWAAGIMHIIVCIAASAAGILIMKSLVEYVLYAQPMAVRIGKNMYAFVADAVMLAVSMPVCRMLYPQAGKLFPDLIRQRK